MNVMLASQNIANGKTAQRRWGWAPVLMAVSMLLGGCRTLASEPNSPKQTAVVTVLGQLQGEQQAAFEAAVRPFEERENIDVVYEGTDRFLTLLRLRLSAMNEPDLVVLPQPGLIADLAAEDLLVPLNEILETSSLKAAYSDTWLDLGTIDNEQYAIWYRASVKSLVWYRPTAFEAKGYGLPTTWAELKNLSDRIVEEGGTPWCIGLESGEATGWPATDWIEDIMLRTAGPEAYQQWIDNRLAFNSPTVQKAFNEFGTFLRKPKYTSVTAEEALNVPYGDSALGLFSEPPNCYMHRQASFITSFFPPEKEPRVDYDVFPLPPIDPKFGNPLLVSGDAVTMFRNTPEARKLMQYLATPEPHIIAAGLGGFMSPQKQVPLDVYPDIVSQNIAQFLLDADVVRFDASDMMPGFVGAGTFWEGMVDFAKGKSVEEVTQEIDDSWP
ncbi:MAG: ABC transporter substrate-binding protein [Phormidesmis sp.]